MYQFLPGQEHCSGFTHLPLFLQAVLQIAVK